MSLDKGLFYAQMTMGILSTVFLIIGGMKYKAMIDLKDYEESGREAQATIIKKYKKRDRHKEDTHMNHAYHYHIKYKFTAQYGDELENDQRVSRQEWDNYQEGQSITVTYILDNPKKNIVNYLQLSAGKDYKTTLKSSVVMYLLFIILFGTRLFFMYKKETAPVIVGDDWYETQVEISNIRPSQTLIDKYYLKRMNVGFNVPLGPDQKAGSLPWVNRALTKEQLQGIEVGSTVKILYPPGEREKAVLKLEVY